MEDWGAEGGGGRGGAPRGRPGSGELMGASRSAATPHEETVSDMEQDHNGRKRGGEVVAYPKRMRVV